ncbi:MAG: four helix bundle protein [Bacteroidota bacterium]|jgi:four helix bundle protein
MENVFEPEVLYESVLKQKSFRFAIRIAKFYKILVQRDKVFDPIFKQILRCGTSIGANISEAQSASSKKDFINKLSISLKESRETLYWIKLLNETETISELELISLQNDCEEIIKMLVSSIKTCKGLQ